MYCNYQELISLENLLKAWQKFYSGKANKKDVIEFWENLEDNIFNLHNELKSENYKHGPYEKFLIFDPKKRLIHKARIKDRIVHQLIFDYLLPVFEKRFIFDSYSSRINKGTHKAVTRLKRFCQNINSRGKRCWVLKCDIEKFFNNINHGILFDFISKRVDNPKSLKIIKEIIDSFEISPGKGLPLGNLTSQLFANVYLHELDYFIKNRLRIKNYIRFNDDFVIVHQSKEFLGNLIPKIQNFLKDELELNLPQNKINLRNINWGADFLGYIILPSGILIRTKTKRRLLRKINKRIKNYMIDTISFNNLVQTINSYLGVLKHCSSFRLRQKILDSIPK